MATTFVICYGFVDLVRVKFVFLTEIQEMAHLKIIDFVHPDRKKGV